jgi:hypothetical protein
LSATAEYVYCVVPAGFDVTGAPFGLDRSAVRLVQNSDLAAVVSDVDAAEYTGEATATAVGDPEWLSPRAVAHDSVITWIADRGAVIPFPMWVLFSDDSAVSSMLESRRAQFHAALDRVSDAREFSVRVSADASALANAAAATDSNLQQLDTQARAASPGQAYLLRRKLAESRKQAARDTALRIADETHSALSSTSRASAPRRTASSTDAGILLDAAYLVPDDRYDAFRSALTETVGTYAPSGVRFDFTGPWPPYHFVSDA